MLGNNNLIYILWYKLCTNSVGMIGGKQRLLKLLKTILYQFSLVNGGSQAIYMEPTSLHMVFLGAPGAPKSSDMAMSSRYMIA